MIVAWALALFTLLGLALLVVELARASRSIRRLSTVIPDLTEWPSITIVIAGRNEERNLAPALESVLALDYPDIEVIFVNDRSTDRTGSIAASIAKSNRRLRVVNVETLPPGWLGKNHALHVGAAEATGSLILFTDADVLFAPSALRRAVTYFEREGVDHLAAAGDVVSKSVPLGMLVATFGFFFVLYARPWRARNPRSRDHIGIGAFNLVRAATYRAVGGHAPIAMRTDDDMMLGKILKKSGARQDFVSGTGMIAVEWYSSIGDMIRGLEKNAFTGLNYSVPFLVVATAGQCALYVWPFVALLCTSGWLLAANGAIVAVELALVGGAAREGGSRWWYAIGFPVGTLIFVYILWRSAILALRNDGIRWRDTHYSLAELRANKV